MPTRTMRLGLTLLAASAMSLAACGNDEVAQAAGSPLCDGIVELDATDSPGGPTEPTEDDLIAFGKTLVPIVGSVRDGLDGELADEFAILDQATDSLEQGDGSSLEDPAVDQALRAVRDRASTLCGFDTIEVGATDHKFDLPTTIKSGRFEVEMTNAGNEPHVFLLVRRTDAATLDDAEFVGAYLEGVEGGGERPAGAEDISGGGPFAEPGGSSSHVYDLTPGTYVYFCPIPSGEGFSGPPHFTLGMVGRVTVEP